MPRPPGGRRGCLFGLLIDVCESVWRWLVVVVIVVVFGVLLIFMMIHGVDSCKCFFSDF